MAVLKALRTMRGRRLGRLPLYEDITPSSRWADGTNGRSFVIDLPGFKKEEVNLEIDESGNVTIKGRHDVGNNRFRRFSLTVKAPEDTEMKEIVGDLEGGLYTVVFPKMVVAGGVQEDKLGDGDGEETEPEQKHLDADKGLETVLGTESSKVMEKAAEESLKEVVADAAVIQAERKLVETAEKKPERLQHQKETILLETGIPEAEKETRTLDSPTVLPQSCIRTKETAIQKPESGTEPETETNPVQTAIQEPETTTKSAEKKPERLQHQKETIMEKTLLETGIPEAEKETRTLESPTVLPQSCLRTEETAIQKPESATKPETETNPAQTAIQEPESTTKSAETAIQEPKTETRPAETVTKPETNSPSEIPKAVFESPAPKTATILPQEKGKRAIKDGPHKHEGIKKDGGFLETVMEKINEHKACIISAILAFSMGILISRKIRN